MDDHDFGRTEPTDSATEALLWQLSSLRSLARSEISGPPIEDGEIERYRGREMSARERRLFEQRLALDEHGMERLARVVTRPSATRRSSWRLAASIALCALATAGLFFSLTDRREGAGRSDLPSYTLSVQGLSERRGFDPSNSHETGPGSVVRIVARPETQPAPNLSFVFYRLGEPGLLKRIPRAAARVEVERGTAVLEAEATALVGDEPGLYELFLLIGPEGFDPPERLENAALDALARAEHLQVHRIELRMLPPDREKRAAKAAAANRRRGSQGHVHR